MGWLRDFSVQRLQELLQTYFGAMRYRIRNRRCVPP
jgi:hypothetical protein